MKKLLILLGISCWAIGITAQTALTLEANNAEAQRQRDEILRKIENFDAEKKLDSLDQKDLPRLVSGGVFGGFNISNFIITRDHNTMSSHMRLGGELGGLLDFRVTKHFSIQPQVIFTAHQNYFAAADTTNRLWSFGVEIPIYFLGRIGNMEKGYFQFGGGMFTHFTYLSNVKGKYQNIDKSDTETGTQKDNYDYSSLYNLHNNHFGLCLMVGYEFSFGMQINASYKVSLSDIASFYKEMKGQPIADALIYPQSFSLHIGYRWR